MVIVVFVILFAIFPLTDTDIWWHLACAREWVQTWTPSRSPVVNVHEYFQMVVGFVYGIGGAPLLVAFKAVLWGAVFALFLLPQRKPCVECQSKSAALIGVVLATLVLFIFRYHFEIRPVLFSLLFLGIYWNLLPEILNSSSHSSRTSRLEPRAFFLLLFVLVIQWLWCKCQGLYILGPLFAVAVLASVWLDAWRLKIKLPKRFRLFHLGVVLALFAMPFLHSEGLNLFLYPFGLLDRLVGMSPSAVVFASEIAENRSPFTLLMAGENALECVVMILLCVAGLVIAVWNVLKRRLGLMPICLFATASLALIAERNFVLYMPVLLYGTVAFSTNHQPPTTNHQPPTTNHFLLPTSYFLLFFLLGLWTRSLLAYDSSMIASQRVPVDAAAWMAAHPHEGHLFNDDRAGGYLEFVNPLEPVYIDGRFILKTADFFERYLRYANDPALFMHDADSLRIGRAIFPLRYYARWGSLLSVLDAQEDWNVAYRDSLYIVLNHDIWNLVSER
jgi:hypothetical protein